ncbi:MAG: pyrophosphatase PpaX [Bacilli bacterium]|nr:pyrophosphatase PpaX [Bacilli bacterium]MBN2696266.1 pyrophosphatase PpaX [Bacilli bacterium]
MTRLDALLFDLDGTLVDSNQLIVESYRKTFAVYDPQRKYTDQEIIDLIGPPLEETFRMYTEDADKIHAMIETYRDSYIEMEFDYVKPYPHMLETLKELKDKGYKLGVVTTKFKVSALPSLQEFGIDTLLDVLIGLDDVDNHKPHPEPIFKALDSLRAKTAMMIGDNASDIFAGKNASIMTCGVNWSIKKAELEQSKPDFWINDFRDLIPLLEKIKKER